MGVIGQGEQGRTGGARLGIPIGRQPKTLQRTEVDDSLSNAFGFLLIDIRGSLGKGHPKFCGLKLPMAAGAMAYGAHSGQQPPIALQLWYTKRSVAGIVIVAGVCEAEPLGEKRGIGNQAAGPARSTTIEARGAWRIRAVVGLPRRPHCRAKGLRRRLSDRAPTFVLPLPFERGLRAAG